MFLDVLDHFKYLFGLFCFTEHQYCGPHHVYHGVTPQIETVPAGEVICVLGHKEIILCVHEPSQIVREWKVVYVHDQRGFIRREVVGHVSVSIVPLFAVLGVALLWLDEFVIN